MVRDRSISNATISPFEFGAVAYLAVPVALFFFAYGTLSVRLPLATFIGFGLWHCWRLVDTRASFRLGRLDAFFLACAAGVVLLSGSFGAGFFPNSDWVKHFAVLRFLIDNSTLTGTAPGYDGASMRYYLGWYVVPALLTKFTSRAALLPIVGTWTTAGLYLFFRVTAQLTESSRWRYTLPAVVMLFSGADALGTSFTNFSRGPQGHLEWWSGWIQYSSMLTDIFWAPQHALSAWLAIALGIRLKDSRASLAVFPLVTASLLLWSPFSAIGIVPFYLWTLARFVRQANTKDIANAIMMLVVTIVIAQYLRTGGSTAGMEFITVFSQPCLSAGPCYSLPNYFWFLAAEVAGFLAALHLATRCRNAMLWIATVLLPVMPFVKFGGANDLNLHATIPALTLLAILSWQALYKARQATTFALACLLTMGAATPLAEIRRSFAMTSGPPVDATVNDLVSALPGLRGQYLVDKTPWMVRKPGAP
jgi:hypothetical protein